MKGITYYQPGVIRTEEVVTPEIAADELLLKVHSSAICGTDLRIYKNGHFKIAEGESRILGHEVSGEISKVGKEVTGFAVGERVATIPNIGCGHCRACIGGFNQLCKDYDAFGINLDGGFAEYMKIPAAALRGHNVVKLPDELSYQEATLIEPFSCAYNSYKQLQTKPGDTVLIIGAGPIGACHVIINKLAGAAQVIVADLEDKRLSEIRDFGADITINSGTADLPAKIAEITEGRGVDVIITACSVPALQQQALEMAAIHGRINFFGGLPQGKNIVPLDTNLIHYKELLVLGTTGSSIEDYMKSLDLAKAEKVKLAKLVSKEFTLDEAQEAFDYALAGQGMKSLFRVE